MANQNTLEDGSFKNYFATVAAEWYKNNVGKNTAEDFINFLWSEMKFEFVDTRKPKIVRANIETQDVVIGNFNCYDWTITMTLKNSVNLTDSAEEIVRTIYHELFHAEQYFRVALLLACEKKLEDEIEYELSICKNTAKKAITMANDNPYLCEDATADKWRIFLTETGYLSYKRTMNEIDHKLQQLNFSSKNNFKGLFDQLEDLHDDLSSIWNNMEPDLKLHDLGTKIKHHIDKFAPMLLQFINKKDVNRLNDSHYRHEMIAHANDLLNELQKIYQDFPHEIDVFNLEDDVGNIFLASLLKLL